MLWSRRSVLGSLATIGLADTALANNAVGVSLAVKGNCALIRGRVETPLEPHVPLFQDDTVRTGEASFASLRLFTDARIDLGPLSLITIDDFTATLGGTLTLGGAMVFDRPEDLPPAEHTILTAFAQIGVRGTRFFAGPSKGEFAIFVERGRVDVLAENGEERWLTPGRGTTLNPPAVDPGFPAIRPGELAMVAPFDPRRSFGPVAVWSDERIAAAYASVGL